VPWLQPYPDRLLDEVAPSDAEPDAVVVARETIELTFLAVIQLLPPRQRAVLILRDVLDWSAAETAELLETSVAAANSALQRARATLRDELPQRRAERPAATDLTPDERALLDGFIATHESGDTAAAAALLAEDVRVTMPPNPAVYDGIASLRPLWRTAFEEGMGEWRLVPTRANRLPAAASYLRRPGDTEHRAFKIDVIRVKDGAIAEVTTFGASLFPAFGLAETL
jgi:RNA polymerase sigma-70 factor (ECF subfamily)